MSSRRSTRAASSRASSTAGSDLGQNTPRRSSRINSTNSLPQLSPVPAASSTSYGSATAALPLNIRRTGQGRDLTETLTDILGTVQESIESDYGYLPTPANTGVQATSESNAGSRGIRPRGASKAPSASNPSATGALPATSGLGLGRANGLTPFVPSTPGVNNASYMNESGLYGDATFFEDPLTTPKPRKRGRNPQTNEAVEEDIIEPANDRISVWMQLHAWLGSLYELIASTLRTMFDLATGLVSSANQIMSSRWTLLILFLFFAIIAAVLNPKSTTGPLVNDNLELAGLDVGHNIRQWFTSSFSHPLSYLNDREISSLSNRVSQVEKELKSLKKNLVLNKEALDELKSMLPDEIYLPKKNGETELPPNFWKGIAKNFPKGFASYKDKSDVVDRSEWDEFIAQNEATVKAWHADMSEDLWARHLKEALQTGGTLISKAEVIEAIDRKWEQSAVQVKRQVKSELGNIEKLFRDHSQQSHGSITAQEARALSKEVFNEMIKNLQLNAFAQGQASENSAYYHLQAPNHFSFGLGAVVNPSVTSPTYAFAQERAWWPKRLILWSVGFGLPTPNPPAEALRKWDEAGDCWCAPARGGGAGVQLGVLMANDIFPKEVVIEHIPKSATLDSSSTPREMELLAKIDGFHAQGTVGELSEKLFPEFAEAYLGKAWILIGTWRYDMEDANNIQHFYPQVDLESLGVSISQLVLRAKDNHGGSDHTCLYRVRVYGEIANKRKV